MRTRCPLILLAFLPLAAPLCPVSAAAQRHYDGYYDRDGGYDRYRDDRERDRLDRERYEIQRERDRIERERERLENERDRLYNQQRAPVSRPAPRESCPPGFTPSENKCTQQERRRGCKDIRLPGGLGCVKR